MTTDDPGDRPAAEAPAEQATPRGRSRAADGVALCTGFGWCTAFAGRRVVRVVRVVDAFVVCEVLGAGEVWCVDVACSGSRKTIETQMVPPCVTAPTPIWVKSWSRMFARCGELCMNAWNSVVTSGP